MRLIVFLFFIPTLLFSQDIWIENASFEGEPQDATMPQRWHSCKKGSTPDILPGFWGVNLRPYDGDTFLGLITREDGSYEAIGQQLAAPLKANECYTFSIRLARSKTYAHYGTPIRLRIYGGISRCERNQLLEESPTIINTDWKEYKFSIIAKADYNFVIFEAFYAKGISFSYRGNILIDDISVWKKCPRAEYREENPIEKNQFLFRKYR